MGLKIKLLNFFRDQCGASAVEFALLAPMLILMIIGTVDIGVFVMERMKLQNLAHTAAEYVVQSQDDANVSVIAEEAYIGDFEDITVTSEFECECADGEAQECPLTCAGSDYQRRFINVTISGTFEPLFPYPYISNGLDMQRSVRMRVD